MGGRMIRAVVFAGLLFAPEAHAGRFAVGMLGASGVSPITPSWQRVGPAGVACGGLVGWHLTGGHDYAGDHGKVMHTADEQRWGVLGQLCSTAGGGAASALGIAYGRQWGGPLYATTHLAVGLSAYQKAGPEPSAYAAYGPFAKPELALGLALPPGISGELGAYAVLAPPLVHHLQGSIPQGVFAGHVGLELTLLVGAASPARPWR